MTCPSDAHDWNRKNVTKLEAAERQILVKGNSSDLNCVLAYRGMGMSCPNVLLREADAISSWLVPPARYLRSPTAARAGITSTDKGLMLWTTFFETSLMALKAESFFGATRPERTHKLGLRQGLR
jgi:hypothetical protein